MKRRLVALVLAIVTYDVVLFRSVLVIGNTQGPLGFGLGFAAGVIAFMAAYGVYNRLSEA